MTPAQIASELGKLGRGKKKTMTDAAMEARRANAILATKARKLNAQKPRKPKSTRKKKI